MKGQNLAIFIQSHEFAKDLQLADEISPCPLELIYIDNLSRAKQKELIRATQSELNLFSAGSLVVQINLL